MPCLHSIVFLPDFNRMIIAQHFKNVTYIFCSKKSVLSYTKNTTSPNGFNTNWLLWDFGDLWSSSFGIFDLFWDLTICNQPIWRCIWLILEFLNLRSCIFRVSIDCIRSLWELQSCIFRVSIDCIWSLGELQSIFPPISLTTFGLFEICSHASPRFFMTAFEVFGICSQLIPWFCLTYLSILPYAVNSGLVQQKLSCSYIDNERFLLTQDMEIRRRDDITTQLLQNSNKSLSNLWIIQQTVNFQSSLNSKPSIIILHRPF